MTPAPAIGGWWGLAGAGGALLVDARNSTPNLAYSFRHNGKVTVAG